MQCDASRKLVRRTRDEEITGMNPESKPVRPFDGFPERFSRLVLRLFGERSPAHVCLCLLGVNLLIIVAALILPPAREVPTYHFHGLRLISYVSVIQLILIAALAYQVYLERPVPAEGAASPARGLHSRNLWLVICLGFLFLALDEIVSIHVLLDKVSDALGHGIGTITLYAIGAVGVLIYFRHEVILFRRSWLLFATGFFCLLLAIAFDSKEIYRIEPWLPRISEIFLSSSGRGITEESLELFSECFLITATYASVFEARRIADRLRT